jgi:hypothetical protein
MTRNEAYLAIVEGWLRDNRGIVFTEGAVDDLCDRIAAEIERLNIRIRQDAEAAFQYLNEIDRLKELVAALREEKEKLYINVANRDAEIERLKAIIGYLEDHADIPISVRRDARALGPNATRNCDHGFSTREDCPTCQHFDKVRSAP